MAGFEQTIIIGNVGRDPESRFLQSGAQVTSFSVAVTTRWTDRNTNEKRERTNWYKVNCWNKLAEISQQYVKKGSQIMVQGTVTANAYMGQDGEPRASLELRAENFQLLGGRVDDSTQDSGGQDYENQDDIPFWHGWDGV